MAKAIMVQGTMSGAGKSLLVAGLCRVFRQDGYRVAPFKSQNMALNSHITREGLEMSRAQAVQAEACGIEPDVRMNPILLKPVTDEGSQVIVNGHVRGHMQAAAYFAMKNTLIPDIMHAYESLAAANDIIVLEGAGSPAEINLKKDDLVNMGMAKRAGAPVLLVGDIDRGGVFAQLYGTLALLDPAERAMVRALIINKFRGDINLLRPGLDSFEKLSGKPFAGVIPFLSVDIEDEDSLSDRLRRKEASGRLDIAVIRMPRISNFTDFAPLEATPDICLRYVDRVEELGHPDLIVLPGTESAVDDLQWLRTGGLEAAVKRAATDGSVVFGIGGGYHMLGSVLTGKDGRGTIREVKGMELLPVRTVSAEEEYRSRFTAEVQPVGGVWAPLAGAAIEGYQIKKELVIPEDHARPLLLLEDGSTEGCWQSHVYGCGVHGFFNTASCREALVKALCIMKGILPGEAPQDRDAYKQEQYERLARGVRDNLDMEKIYAILDTGL